MKLPDMLIPGPLKKPQKPGVGDGAGPVDRGDSGLVLAINSLPAVFTPEPRA